MLWLIDSTGGIGGSFLSGSPSFTFYFSGRSLFPLQYNILFGLGSLLSPDHSLGDMIIYWALFKISYAIVIHIKKLSLFFFFLSSIMRNLEVWPQLSWMYALVSIMAFHLLHQLWLLIPSSASWPLGHCELENVLLVPFFIYWIGSWIFNDLIMNKSARILFISPVFVSF